ncbi:ceramide glucosyltransferase [Neogemmobacter tilapiae]|uniref:Ceramide glucosyltransferase n=1 Tax=Neogemmobacter tilapiae TaxID=875041 RepID=A0A918TXI5_9RHOB|nr:ceramide glucosyltransferase [Gemmobacter tilapiae]GHC64805.1 ceramide glucosyltransferase [Gemmobacter tilapiae]
MIGTVLASGLLTAHLATVGLVGWRLTQGTGRRGVITGQPMITLLRPVCGVDAFDRETLESSFLQDWPDYELIFCAPSERDPAVALVRELIAKHPEVRALLLAGQTRITGNPKLDNLWKGWQAAGAEWICMADSNLMLPPNYLRSLVAAWDDKTGLVTSPAAGSRADGWAASLEAAFLNGNQGRLQLACDSLGQGFAQGKSLFWNKSLLEEAGGLLKLGRWLAEDVSATRLVRAMGRKVRLTPAPFAQPLGRRKFRAVWDRQLRWSRVRRDGFPGIFALEWVNGAFLPVLLLMLAGHSELLLPFVALWYGAEWALARLAGWPHGWRDLLAMPLRDALIWPLWLATWARRGIVWRGHEMDIPEAS